MGDLGTIFVLALAAMANPTLLAAVTVLMLLPDTKRLMLGYLLGAYLTSISLGLLIVFSLHGSASADTAHHTLSPAQDIVIGLIALIAGVALRGGRVEAMRERRRRRKGGGPKKESLPERMLGRGSARVTFCAGILLTFPGGSYLVALNRMADLGAGTAATAALVVAFCLIQMLLLEVPLVGYAIAPERTQERVVRFRDWLGRNGRRAAADGAIAIGALLLLRAAIELIF